MNFNHRDLQLWTAIIPSFKYNREQPFFEMLVPTTDTVRYGYLMEKLLSVRRSVLFTGDTGVGKVKNLRTDNKWMTKGTFYKSKVFLMLLDDAKRTAEKKHIRLGYFRLLFALHKQRPTACVADALLQPHLALDRTLHIHVIFC